MWSPDVRHLPVTNFLYKSSLGGPLLKFKDLNLLKLALGPVAQLVMCLTADTRLTADSGVPSSIPTMVQYFCGDVLIQEGL